LKEPSTRRHTRIPLTLPLRVRYQESSELEWTEQSRLIDVNRFGACFTLKRPVEVGRLMQLTIPLPRQLRYFDYAESRYVVWSLVRHIASLPVANQQETSVFRVGVIFVGKWPPADYEINPTCRFEAIEGGDNSMWQLRRRTSARQRRETRLRLPLEVMVETLDENGNSAHQEYTVTETLSSLGTCVPTSLDVGVGRILRVTGVRDPVSLFAVIRSREVAPDGIARLGLEFVDGRWPLMRD